MEMERTAKMYYVPSLYLIGKKTKHIGLCPNFDIRLPHQHPEEKDNWLIESINQLVAKVIVEQPRLHRFC